MFTDDDVYVVHATSEYSALQQHIYRFTSPSVCFGSDGKLTAQVKYNIISHGSGIAQCVCVCVGEESKDHHEPALKERPAEEVSARLAQQDKAEQDALAGG